MTEAKNNGIMILQKEEVMDEQKILEAYADGSPLELIIDSFDLERSQVLDILLTYKENNRFKKTFTNEFKRLIAERDINGIARKKIAEELQLNVNTIKKACENFGQAIKEKATSDNIFTRIDGEFDLKICPSCGSKRNNLVDEKTTFCLTCDSEHVYHKDHVLKVNFEYIEE